VQFGILLQPSEVVPTLVASDTIVLCWLALWT
jgi:hypothetical protein